MAAAQVKPEADAGALSRVRACKQNIINRQATHAACLRLNEVVPLKELAQFTPKEMQHLVSGSRDYDMVSNVCEPAFELVLATYICVPLGSLGRKALMLGARY